MCEKSRHLCQQETECESAIENSTASPLPPCQHQHEQALVSVFCENQQRKTYHAVETHNTCSPLFLTLSALRMSNKHHTLSRRTGNRNRPASSHSKLAH